MQERLISIITPFYNAESFMNTPYKSLLKQTYKNWEWICVDDKSTDNTLQILQDWAKKDSRIKVIAREKNGGSATFGFNSGLPYCNGSHIQLLGHDDELTPDTLEEIVKRIEETNADIVIPDAELINDLVDSSPNFKMIGIKPYKNDKNFSINDRNVILSPLDAFKLSLNWRIHTWACYSTNLVKKYGFLEEGMNGDEYSTRLFLLNSNKVVFSNGTYRYLRRKESISNKISIRYFNKFDVEEKTHELVKINHLEKKYLKIANKSLLHYYFDDYIKYLVNKDSFTKEESTKIEDMLTHGNKLIYKYCSIYEILKSRTRLYKYRFIICLWKYLDNYLKRKNIIK